MQDNILHAVFFANDAHRHNFNHCLEKFHNRSREYMATCYLAAFPEIFKCFKLELQTHGPFDWYFEHLEGQTTSGTTAPLTSQTTALVELALNLWNGREFDLAEGISMWDSDLYKVALQAIQLRRFTINHNNTESSEIA